MDMNLQSGSSSGIQVRGFRFWIAFLLFLSTVICYLDRLTISILAPVIKQDLSLSNFQYAGISTWFLVSYSVFQTVFGRIYDRVGTRKAFGAAISLWSVCAMLHAAARSVTGFAIFRFALGIGEAGNWPGSIKAIAEWFPPKQRAFGLSIVNCGAALGSVIAPPLIVWLQLRFGWKAAFIATGGLGFAWLVLWLLFYQSPEQSRFLSRRELDFIKDAGVKQAGPDQPTRSSWREVVRRRQVWGIVLARFFGDPIWWLYLIWLPSYLYDVRGFSMKDIGAFAWVPFLASGIGSLTGGWLSGFLIQKGHTVNSARKTAIIIPTFLMPLGIVAVYTPSPVWALFCMSLVLFGFQFWVNNIQTLPSDYFSKQDIATVAGLSQTGAGVGSMLFTLGIGWIVDHFSYTPVLIIAGLLGPAATASVILLSGKIEKLKT